MADSVEKVYCCDRPDNSAMWAALMNNRNDAAEFTALSNNNQWNNPFMYLVWLSMFRNGGFYGENSGNVSSRLDEISTRMNTNQNTNLMMDAINGNHEALHSLSANLGVSVAHLQGAISSVQNAITQVGGQVGFSSERVINAVLMGNKDLTAAIQNCCCNTQQSILKMGYESQIATLNQTNTLQERLTGIANGIQQGFSSTAYENQRQTCEIINSGKENTQRIIDALNNHWGLELSQKLQDTKAELSQERQTAYLISQLKPAA